jgi:hypothetical protein
MVNFVRLNECDVSNIMVKYDKEKNKCFVYTCQYSYGNNSSINTFNLELPENDIDLIISNDSSIEYKLVLKFAISNRFKDNLTNINEILKHQISKSQHFRSYNRIPELFKCQKDSTTGENIDGSNFCIFANLYKRIPIIMPNGKSFEQWLIDGYSPNNSNYIKIRKDISANLFKYMRKYTYKCIPVIQTEIYIGSNGINFHVKIRSIIITEINNPLAFQLSTLKTLNVNMDDMNLYRDYFYDKLVDDNNNNNNNDNNDNNDTNNNVDEIYTKIPQIPQIDNILNIL